MSPPARPDGDERSTMQMWFDAAYYRTQGVDVVDDPLAHYLTLGWRMGLDPHPLFSSNYYLDENIDVADAGICPLAHYARHGAVEGRRPHPLFDPAYYCARYPDIAEPSLDPLSHFVRWGGAEWRDPNPWFDTAFYAASVPGLAETGGNPLVHYATVGWRDGHDPHPDFDVAFYRAANPDLGGREPLTHYLSVGWRAGREPCPDFVLRSLRRPTGDPPVHRCRLVVLADGGAVSDPDRLLPRCPAITLSTPSRYQAIAGDYVYLPDRAHASLCATDLINVVVCLAHQCYDFVVVSHGRSNGSMVLAGSPDNAVVMSADGHARRRSGYPLAPGSTGRFIRLPAPELASLTDMAIDRLGLGTLMRFGADLVVADGAVVRPPTVARRRPATPVLSAGGGSGADGWLQLAELGPSDLHEQMRLAIGLISRSG